uniref:Uncharacterized protein n=2 Tax=Picea TaxID=3328 RepID=A0A101LU31_PICGL|nr:hypothetical protein ABT39_MTgene3444 [Picea glauca]QHR92700.1 hypothetical protein Q903MT_gene6748 [Picea sitchensis]
MSLFTASTYYIETMVPTIMLGSYTILITRCMIPITLADTYMACIGLFPVYKRTKSLYYTYPNRSAFGIGYI